MTDGPRVTVAVPSYNHACYLAEAVEGALAQTVPAADVEVVVVDDASTDATPEVLGRWAAHPRVRVLRHDRNRGVSATFNHCLAEARAPWFALLPSDDRWRPEHLEVSLARLAQVQDACLVYGRAGMIDEEGRPMPPGECIFGDEAPEGDVLARLVEGNFVPLASVVARAQVLREAGGFDEGVRVTQDLGLWMRVAARHPIWCTGRGTVEVRWTGENVSYPRPEKVARIQRDKIAALERLLVDCAAEVERRGLGPRVQRVLASSHAKIGRRERDPARLAEALRLDPWRPAYWLDWLRLWLDRGRRRSSPRDGTGEAE
ncbi:MAG: glycosyltransferase family 2 protein [Planctomycetes bacterium]|nr:glycosyltransferase family 2 protein [Planctomycetota bacterium]